MGGYQYLRRESERFALFSQISRRAVAPTAIGSSRSIEKNATLRYCKKHLEQNCLNSFLFFFSYVIFLSVVWNFLSRRSENPNTRCEKFCIRIPRYRCLNIKINRPKVYFRTSGSVAGMSEFCENLSHRRRKRRRSQLNTIESAYKAAPEEIDSLTHVRMHACRDESKQRGSVRCGMRKVIIPAPTFNAPRADQYPSDTLRAFYLHSPYFHLSDILGKRTRQFSCRRRRFDGTIVPVSAATPSIGRRYQRVAHSIEDLG